MNASAPDTLDSRNAITLLQLNTLIQKVVSATPGIHDVWITAETSDVRTSGPHCYLQLIQKDEQGATVARISASIWGNVWSVVSRKFAIATGAAITSGIRIMLRGNVSFHPYHGISVTITDIDPTYTIGDAERRLRELRQRLTQEGLIGLNKTIPWGDMPQRIAVISAPGAAGYGDFSHQMAHNEAHLRFTTALFPAIMQGQNTAQTVITAIETILRERSRWDCIVIIRGGGSTSDLDAFNNYDLAAAVARCPLPVIVGIGHERDHTILDEVAKISTKTPTAAAEWLIAKGKSALKRFTELGSTMALLAQKILADNRTRYTQAALSLPTIAQRAVGDASRTLQSHATTLYRDVAAVISDASRTLILAGGRLAHADQATLNAQRNALDNAAAAIPPAINARLRLAGSILDAKATLIDALSPEKVIARGYTLTYNANGHIITSAGDINVDDEITTRLADGSTILSQVKSKQQK